MGIKSLHEWWPCKESEDQPERAIRLSPVPESVGRHPSPLFSGCRLFFSRTEKSLSRNLTLLSQVLVFGVEMHRSVLVVHEIPAAGRREVEQDRALPAR